MGDQKELILSVACK